MVFERVLKDSDFSHIFASFGLQRKEKRKKTLNLVNIFFKYTGMEKPNISNVQVKVLSLLLQEYLFSDNAVLLESY